MHKVRMIVEMSLVAVGVLAFAVGAHATAPTQLDHYLCYSAKLSKGEPKFTRPYPSKTLIDQFENRIYDVKAPKWHCNPARKIYLGVTDPRIFPDIHLEGYPIALTKTTPSQSAEIKAHNHITVDQFGFLKIIVRKPESLNVRTSKTNLGPYPFVSCSPTKSCFTGVCQPATGGFCLQDPTFPLAPANDDSVDNFKCYHIGLQKGFTFTKIVGQVALSDEFWTPFDTFDIVKPTRLCTPVDKDGENVDAPGHPGHLVCYKTRLSTVPRGTFPPKDKFPKFKVADSNGNLQDNRLDVKAVRELCVPAQKITCGDGVVDPPYEDCDAPGNTDQCPGGAACGADCHCP